MSSERIISIKELKNFNGEDGPMYVAYNGFIYDVSESRRWKSGLHEGLHYPGQDLTQELSESPHGDEVFNHLNIRIVGRLRQ